MRLKRWQKVALGILLLKAAIVAAIWIWGPKLAIEYLNRPDTDLRRKLSTACSEALGEPVALTFTLSDARLSPAFHLMIDLTGIEIRSPTFDKLGTTVRAAALDIPLRESFREKKVVFERMRFDIPRVFLSKGKDGAWAWSRPAAARDTAPVHIAEGKAPGEKVKIKLVEILIDSAEIRVERDGCAGQLAVTVSWRTEPDTTVFTLHSTRIEHLSCDAGNVAFHFPALLAGGDIFIGKDRSTCATLNIGTGLDTFFLQSELTKSHVRIRGEGELFSGKLAANVEGPANMSDMNLSAKLDGADMSGVNPRLSKKGVQLGGTADITADFKHLSGNLSRASGVATFSGKNVDISGLPSFTTLAAALNEITEAVGKLGKASLKELLGTVTGSARAAVTAKGTTRFDDVSISANIENGVAQIPAAKFTNSELQITATGAVQLQNGGLNMSALIVFKEEALRNIESGTARDILREGVTLPVRGTVMDPKFDKEKFLAPLAKRAGKKILEETLGDLLRRKLGTP